MKLSDDIGPLPAWVWLGVAAVAVLLYRGRVGASGAIELSDEAPFVAARFSTRRPMTLPRPVGDEPSGGENAEEASGGGSASFGRGSYVFANEGATDESGSARRMSTETMTLSSDSPTSNPWYHVGLGPSAPIHPGILDRGDGRSTPPMDSWNRPPRPSGTIRTSGPR